MKIRLLFVYAFSLLAIGNLLKAQLEMPLTFDEAMEFTFTDFGPDVENDGRPTDKVTTVVADPDNAENMVAANIKPAGAQTWSGVTFWDAVKVPLSESETKLSVRVRTPEANTPILLKIENNLSPAHNVEKTVNSTKADEWEILTFDFAEHTGSTPLSFDELLPVYNRISIFFDFGTGGGASDTTYYFEDVSLGGPEVLNLPFDFESDTLVFSFTDFDGGAATIIDNPDMSEANDSAKVGQMIRDGGQPWAGSTLGTEDTIFFGDSVLISMQVWSPRVGVPVLMKLEGAAPVERRVNTTVANAWETLLFDFSGDTGGVYQNITLIFDIDSVGDGTADSTFYFDNIKFQAKALTLPLDLEDGDVVYNWTNFDGGQSERIENPDKSGINESDFVARMVRDGGQVWAGSRMDFTGGLDFSESSVFKMKVWSPAVGIPVLMKLEPSDPPVELSVNTTVANEWEELTFDFTGMTEGEFVGLTWIFNLGTLGDGSANSTYYYDDVILFGDSSNNVQVDLPITFDPGVTYALTPFEGIGTATITDDPVDGASNPVLMLNRTASAATFAGVQIGTTGFKTAFPFSETATQISMRIYSPAAGINVRMKIEDTSNDAIFAETEAATTMMNMWETLVFDFGQPVEGSPSVSESNTYDKIIVFPNFGVDGATAGEQVFYIDDLMWTGQSNEGLGGLLKIDLPITFSENPEEVDFTLFDFEGANTILGPDPMDAENVVAITQKGVNAQTWAGTVTSTLAGLRNPIPFTNDMLQISVRVMSPDVGTPILLKAEDANDGNKSVETLVMTTVANEWETLVFDFANHADGTPAYNPETTYSRLNIFFNFLNPGEDKIYHWDDVMMVDTTPRAEATDSGSSTITMTMDPGPEVEAGKLVFLDDGTELGKIESVAGRVITLEAPLAVAIPADSRLTFVVDNTPDTSAGKLINLSTRSQVGTGENVLIGGFVVGAADQEVLIQATGPELANAGVAGVLADPFLTITDISDPQNPMVLDTNDNWQDDQGQLISDLWGGAPPLADGSMSAAIVITLQTGSYTATISGVGDTTGVALVEVYEID